MSKIVLTGGGTAGHATPNIALIPFLEQDGHEVLYIGTEKGIERELVEKTGTRYLPISAGKLRRYFSMENLTDIFRILKGYGQSKKIMREEKPDIVFSKGGFVTVPVVFAAHRYHIPVVIHESDLTPGLANKLALPKADKVCVTFESTVKHIKGDCTVTGLPVRRELFGGSREKGLEFLGFDGKKPILLIIGGSLGAQAVNEAVDNAMDALLEMFDIAHVRGNGKLNPAMENKAGYRQFEYVSAELPDLFHTADLALSRAGANVIFELLALAKPALLVPLPKESSRGDQVLNAEFFRSKGYARVLEQADITPETLVARLKDLLDSSEQIRETMRSSDLSDGTGNVIRVIYNTLDK